jgi:hypothetical protein
VSHLLLLDRRNSGVGPTLFAAELEKLSPVSTVLGGDRATAGGCFERSGDALKEYAGRRPGARKWEEREDVARRFSKARDIDMEVQDGLA